MLRKTLLKSQCIWHFKIEKSIIVTFFLKILFEYSSKYKTLLLIWKKPDNKTPTAEWE